MPSKAGWFTLPAPNLGDDVIRPACTEEWVNPEWFWYDDGKYGSGKPNDDLIHVQAIQVCDRCPLKEPCDQWAFDQKIEVGVWGGRTPRERRRMLREMRQKQRPTVPCEYTQGVRRCGKPSTHVVSYGGARHPLCAEHAHWKWHPIDLGKAISRITRNNIPNCSHMSAVA